MLNFESDYITGAHPKILERLVETNLMPESGYGKDRFTTSAAEKLTLPKNRAISKCAGRISLCDTVMLNSRLPRVSRCAMITAADSRSTACRTGQSINMAARPRFLFFTFSMRI